MTSRAHGTWSAPSRSTLPRVRRKLKIRWTTSGLYDRRSRGRRNGKAKGNSLGVVRGPVENAESDRFISVHNRAEMGRREFHISEFFRKWLGTGAPGRTRTCGPRLRRPIRYPTELRARAPFEKPVRSCFDKGFNSDAQVVATLMFGKQVFSAQHGDVFHSLARVLATAPI